MFKKSSCAKQMVVYSENVFSSHCPENGIVLFSINSFQKRMKKKWMIKLGQSTSSFLVYKTSQFLDFLKLWDVNYCVI